MSQATNTMVGGAGGDTAAAAWVKQNANAGAHWSWQSGAVAPTSPPTYLRWLDTAVAAKPLKINTGTPGVPVWVTLFPDVLVASGGLLSLAGGTLTGAINMGGFAITNMLDGVAAGDASTKGQNDNKQIPIAVRVTIPAGAFGTVDLPLIVSPAGLTVLEVSLLSNTATAGSGAGTKYDFQVRNVGTAGAGTVDMLSAVKSTNGAEIGVHDSYVLGVDQNQTMVASEGLVLRVTKTGSPTDLNPALITATVLLKVAT